MVKCGECIHWRYLEDIGESQCGRIVDYIDTQGTPAYISPIFTGARLHTEASFGCTLGERREAE